METEKEGDDEELLVGVDAPHVGRHPPISDKGDKGDKG